MIRTLHVHHPAIQAPMGDGWRRVVARLLRAASAALARHARHVDRPLHARLRRPAHEPLVEFHAEAGAPEGALYVEGRYIGTIDVRRL